MLQLYVRKIRMERVKVYFIRFPFCMINEEIDDSNEKAHRGSTLNITGHVIL